MKVLITILSFIFFFTFLNASNLTTAKTISSEELFLQDSKKILKVVLKSKKSPSLLSRKFTIKYYKSHNYIPFWIDSNGIKKISYDLINSINNDAVLQPYLDKLFKLDEVSKQIEVCKSTKDINDLIQFDIMLTSAYHHYMQYLSKGLLNWEEFEKRLMQIKEEKQIIANWKKYELRKYIRKLLYKAVKESNIQIAIDEVNYTFSNAKELSRKIKEYEELSLNGGFIKIPQIKKSLKKGNYYPEIIQLRQRLLQSNDLANNICLEKEVSVFLEEKDCLELFDEDVYIAVKSFQKNHGLVVDGIIGKNTIEKLNISVEDKIKKMRINLERMRWMPRTLGEKHLLVNIPDFKLQMYNKNKIDLQMDVVVGEFKNPTPIFSHKMNSIVLNPYWRIPQSIVKKEIIPKLIENPNYLIENDIKVFENWDHNSLEYDVSGVDWTMYLGNDLIGNSALAPMRFIQIPGTKNPLGKMKFMFPNRYSVYLHDTPFKSLFKNNKRAYSHGCIRLAEPNKLLEAISKEEKELDFKNVEKILENIEKTDFDLNKKIPVHIVYLTSWIDENGKLQFRDDIYNYDKIQEEILSNMFL